METFYIHTDIKTGFPLVLEDQNEVLHAYSSLRIKPGDSVDIINGMGERFKAEVMECTKKILSVIPNVKIDDEKEYSEVRLSVAVSLLNRNSKMKLLMEKLTELGISRFIPFTSERTAFPKMKTESLRPSMISALKQCGGCRDVEISETLKFSEILKSENFDHKYFSDISGGKSPGNEIKGNILVAVGPEGGFTDNEKKEMISAGFVPLKLNRRTLRAETAAIVTASKFLS